MENFQATMASAETRKEVEEAIITNSETMDMNNNNTNSMMLNNHTSAFIPSSSATASIHESPINDVVCYCCQEIGHFAMQCPHNPKGNMRNRNLTMMTPQNRGKLPQRSELNTEMRYSNNDSARKLRNKRRPCRYNLAGRCRQGEDCAFSHDIESYRNINKSINYTNMHHMIPTQVRMYPHHPMMYPPHHTMPYSTDYMYQSTSIHNNEHLTGEEELGNDETKGHENHQNGGQTACNTRYDPSWMNAQSIHQQYFSNSHHVGPPVSQYNHYGMAPYLMHNGPSIMSPYPMQYMPAYPMYSPSPVAPVQPVAQSPADLAPLEQHSSPVNSVDTTSSAAAESPHNNKILSDDDGALQYSSSGTVVADAEPTPTSQLHSPRSPFPLKSDDAMMNSMANTLPIKESEEIMDDMLQGCEEGIKLVDLEEVVTSPRQQAIALSSPIPLNLENKAVNIAKDKIKSVEVTNKLSRGLQNETGQNNCFLNVIIQALYHTKSFQNLFNQTKKHQCNENHINCVHCAMQEIFNKLNKENSENNMISPTSLRKTLSSLSSCFDAGLMSDAAEAHEILLKALHQCSYTLYDQQLADICPTSCNFENAKSRPLEGRSCLVHECFGMYIMEKATCHRCQQTVKGHQYGTTILYVPTAKLYEVRKQSPNLPFDRILNSALMGDSKKCANEKCMNDHVISSSMMVGNLPKMLTFGFTWATLQAKPEFLSSVIHAIAESITLGEVFKECQQRDVHRSYKLISMVCYFGSHYSVFCFEEKTSEWFSFDDEKVQYIGKDFKVVLNNCSKGRLQPLLLFYALIDEGKEKETQQLGSFEFMIGDIILSVSREENVER